MCPLYFRSPSVLKGLLCCPLLYMLLILAGRQDGRLFEFKFGLDGTGLTSWRPTKSVTCLVQLQLRCAAQSAQLL